MSKTLQEIMTSDVGDIFLSDFAVSAVFTHGGTPATISVIFDNDFKTINVDTGMVESAGPQAHCKSSDVSSAVHGDTLTISGTVYNIIGIQPDGTVLTILILSKD